MKRRILYELAMWRGLFRCLRYGHVMVYGGFGWRYCWGCFAGYPFTPSRLRAFLACLRPRDEAHWR